MSETLLEVQGAKKYFKIESKKLFEKSKYLKAVDDVSFSIQRGETLGLVGESGCGKSTLSRIIMQLTDITDGKILFEDTDILKLKGKKLREARGQMQMIFQNPFYSLNPRMTVGRLIGEPLSIHRVGSREERAARVKALLNLVGLSEDYAGRYPHEFSGGQRQRIGIARALAINPKLIICDEPVSALDVSIQSQILNLLIDLQKKLNLTYLFISHNLSVVKYISNRIAVMYLGKIVELSESQVLYQEPQHPYTQALLSAIPVTDKSLKKDRIILNGDIPNAVNPPSGCRFCTRCWKAQDLCHTTEPSLKDIGNGHLVACHFCDSKTPQ